MKFIYLCLAFVLLFGHSLLAQEHATIQGKITAADGEVLPGVYVLLDSTHYGLTNEDGAYRLTVPTGRYRLTCKAMGYKTHTVDIELKAGKIFEHNIVLEFDNQVLESVEVVGKSALQEVRESAYNVVAIDTKALANASLDLSQAMERTSGLRIRRTGGTGSKTSISLNGFTGQHVKIFLDGVPMNSFGSAFQINNIPVNIADRIEVYKGVVPIELGSDALGGAINIITKKTANTYVDASYSYGSFNTHKSNINIGTTTRSGLTFSLNAFQNYSDNNYEVKSVLLDLNTNTYSAEEHWYKRFHDQYHNETVIGKIGVVHKPWADRLLLGATLAQEHADIQNSNLMKIVFGGRTKSSTTVMPSLEYAKKNLLTKNLDVTLAANYSQVKNLNVDTVARQYNWKGQYVTKTTKGEGDYGMGRYRNNSSLVSTNLSYTPNAKHALAFNNILSGYERKETDGKATTENSSAADSIKRSNIKDVMGLSYRYQASERWNMSAFAKYYAVQITGPVDTSSTSTSYYARQTRKFQTPGYGLTSSYNVTQAIQLKLSFERTYRLPTETELFGDEVTETGEITLKPEHSKNVNFNVRYFSHLGQGNDHTVYLDAGVIYRDTRDYIRRQIDQRYGNGYYSNHGQVRTMGIDLEGRYYYQNRFSIGGNITYQDMRNMEKYSSTGQRLIYYKDRMPNVPYLFGNADASYQFNDVWGKGNVLSISYFLNYIHEFFRQWESEGSDKLTIPQQLSHDLMITYALQNGRYNVALEAKNFTDEILYDNYSLQKPGRSFSVKVRYFFMKQHHH